MEKKKKIFDLISRLSVAYHGNIPDERIKVYCEALANVDLVLLHESLQKCLLNYKYFPSLAEIMEFMGPPKIDTKDSANEMAGEILLAMRNFGYYQETEARKFLGEIKWAAIQSFGGWRELAMIETAHMHTARAQLRDICKMTINLNKNNNQENSRIESGKLKKLDFSNF